MAPDHHESALSRTAYVLMLGVFNAFIVVSWLPRPTTVGESDVGVSAVLLLAIGALLLVSARRGRVDPHAAGLRVVLLAALAFVIFWGYLGMYGLDAPLRAGRLLLSLGQGVLLILVVTSVLSTSALRVSLAVSAFMLTITALAASYNYLGGQPESLTILRSGYDRSSGFFKNPNQLGIVAAMTVPFAVALCLQPGRRTVGALVACSAFLCLVLAASKTNLLLAVLLTATTLCYMLLVSGRARATLIVLPLLAGLVIAGGMPLLDLFNPRAASILQTEFENGDDSSATVQQRLELWAYSVDVMRRRPWFGEGTGQPVATGVYEHSHSHNAFFDIGRTTGLPGFFGAILIVLSVVWAAVHTLSRLARIKPRLGRRRPDRALVIGASIAALSYLVSNQMSDSFGPSTSVFLWMCAGTILRRQDLLAESGRFADPSPADTGRGSPRQGLSTPVSQHAAHARPSYATREFRAGSPGSDRTSVRAMGRLLAPPSDPGAGVDGDDPSARRSPTADSERAAAPVPSPAPATHLPARDPTASIAERTTTPVAGSTSAARSRASTRTDARSKLRIVQVVTRLQPNPSAESTIASCLYQRARGSEVYLIFGRDHDPALVTELAPLIHCVRIPALAESVHPFGDFRAWRALRQSYARIQPHIVHTHAGKAGLLGRLAADPSRTGIVHTAGTPDFSNLGVLKRMLYVTLERICARRTHDIIVGNAGVRRAFLRHRIGQAERHHVVRAGPEFETLRRTSARRRARTAEPSAASLNTATPLERWLDDPKVFLVATIAAFESHGREEAFIAAMTPLLQREPELRLVFSGAGPRLGACTRLASDLGIDRQVHFAGNVRSADYWIAKADLCALASEHDDVACLRFVDAGKPVVLTEFAGVDDIVQHGHNGIVLASDDVLGVVREIERLVNDPDTLTELTRNASVAEAAHRDVSRMGERLRRLYDSLHASLGKHPNYKPG